MTPEEMAGGLEMLEIVSGVVFGLDNSVPDAPHGRLTPREALEQALIAPLQSPPCGVAFSGGRDSSAVLGAATAAARRHQLPDPVPVTLRFAGIDSTEETSFQESVVRHLGLRDWICLEPADSLDILGDIATDLTVRHGLLYPGNIHFVVPMLEAIRGGALMTGIGGDEVLEGHPNHALVAMLAGRRRPTQRLLRTLAKRYVARGRNGNQIRNELAGSFPWLLPGIRSEVVEQVVQDLSSGPLFADRYLVSTTHRMRYLHRAQDDLSRVARGFDVTVAHPLVDPAFIGAVADDVGRIGLATRTAMMQRFFGDLLPIEVIERTGKARFDDVLWTDSTRDAALSLPVEHLADVVDPVALRNVWSSDALKGNTFLMAKYLKGGLAAASDHTNSEGTEPARAVDINDVNR